MNEQEMPLDELSRYVTQQQLLEFGEMRCREIAATVRTASGELTRRDVQEAVSEFRAELAQQRAAMQRSQEAAFWARVNAALPRWRETNADEAFLRWLGERDALSDRIRQDVLNEARRELDADRVIAIFMAWAELQAKAQSKKEKAR